MSAERPTKISAPMTEPSIDQNVHENTERGNAEGAGSLCAKGADTSAKPKGDGSQLDRINEQLQKSGMSDKYKGWLENEKHKIEGGGNVAAENKPDESSEPSTSPSEDYGQNNSRVQDSNLANDKKEAANDSQSKLNQLKSQLKDDYGQSGKQSDSTPTNSEQTEDIKI